MTKLILKIDGTSKPAYQTVTYIKWHMPDVLIQLILLMMITWLLETY